MFTPDEELTDLKDIKPRNFIKGTLLIVLIVGILVGKNYLIDPGMREGVLTGSAALAVALIAYSLIGFISGFFFPQLKVLIAPALAFILVYDTAVRDIISALIFTAILGLVFIFSFLGAAVKEKLFPNF